LSKGLQPVSSITVAAVRCQLPQGKARGARFGQAEQATTNAALRQLVPQPVGTPVIFRTPAPYPAAADPLHTAVGAVCFEKNGRRRGHGDC